MNKLIAVNKQDKVLCYKNWEKCHQLKGIFHRAFSIFIFNDFGELLIQQRSKGKPLWPLYWSNTCCSHPRKGEKVLEAAKRRLEEEMGFGCELRILYKFAYKAKYKNVGSENELCYVLLGNYDGKNIRASAEETADHKWVDLRWLEKDMRENSNIYTPWFKKIIKNISH